MGVKGQREVDSLGIVLFFSGRVCVSVCVEREWGRKVFFCFFGGGGAYEALTFDQQISSDHPDYSFFS